MFRKLVAALRSVGRFLTGYHTPVRVLVNIGPIGISVRVEKGSVTAPSVRADISYDKHDHLSADIFVGLFGVYVRISRAHQIR
mgnify:CR=1 FL=1